MTLKPRSRWSPIPAGEPLLCGLADSYPTRRDHGSADYQLLLTTNGCGRFACADHSLACNTRPGDVVLLRPGAVHDYGPEKCPEADSEKVATGAGAGSWRWIWIHFHAPQAWLPLLDWPEVAPGCGLLRAPERSVSEHLESRLRDVERLARGAWPRRGWMAMNALEEVLLWCDARQLSSTGRRMDPRVRLILDRLAQDLASPCRRSELACHAGISISRLAALFHSEVGVGIAQYRDRLRLERAAQLLRASSEPIARIAAAVGYDSPFHFSIRFKAFTGHSPRAYRQASD